MEHSINGARRRTLDLPAKPEAGLAEWTSKIKALQRQVDEDEEAEHKRLEEEIAASRLARLRRSTGYGSRAGSLDLSQSELVHSLKEEEGPTSAGDATRDRQKSQDDALRKLTGDDRDVHISRDPSALNTRTPMTRANLPTQTPTAPISLAAFMGGRATGPRLTRQAPQQDAHDPTQFEQRTHITAPHPVFGRGGVAMPGMTGKGSVSVVSVAIREEQKKAGALPEPVQRDRRISTPSVAKTYTEKVTEESVAPEKTVPSQTARLRTISTPTGIAPVKAVPPPPTSTKPEFVPPSHPIPYSPSPNLRPTTPNDRRTTGNGVDTSPPLSTPPILRPLSAPRTPRPPSPPKSSITTPMLARPIQPTPRQAPNSPQIPPSQNPSPAFLRPPPQKDPTPSISRLQGRGFVHNMVKKSSELEAGATPDGSPLPDRKDSGSKKHPSVLDRWQVGAGGSTPPPPIVSPKPVAMRKSYTVEPSSPSPTYISSTTVKPDHTGRSLGQSASQPDLRLPSSVSEGGRRTPRSPGLGSSSTMISYIKPTKTGDQPTATPPPPSRSPAVSPEVDELGVRVRSEGIARSGKGSTELPSSPGKPLSHPTKDRAKKPRKAKDSHDTVRGNLSVAATPGMPSITETPYTAENHDISVSVGAPQTINPADGSLPAANIHVPQRPPAASQDASITRDGPLSFSTSRPVIPSKPSPSADQNETPIRRVTGLGLVVPAVESPVQNAEISPPTPSRHVRIPSTGNRATVMDVAQTFHDVLRDSPIAEPTSPQVAREQLQDGQQSNDEEDSPPNVKSLVANWGPRNGAPHPGSQAEKRRSSYEKYSAIMMPPLEEEKTPISSPAGTLSRAAAAPVVAIETVHEVDEQALKENENVPVVPSEKIEPVIEAQPELIHIDDVDEPLPVIDVDALLNTQKPSPEQDVQTISVEVMSIIASTALAIPRDTHVFYDTEVLAVIHRAKARSSGLVATKVWAWHGRRSQAGERETRKLQELARRYGTALITVHQYCEPSELVFVLGGQLAIRQGTRAHWTPENTAMHLVRYLGGATYIDELDLSIKNLCSGFSYCMSLLDTFYVWYGCGSVENEQRAALAYAQALASSGTNILELTEGLSDDDEMFWMILGDGEYAKADYWKWRPSTPSTEPRVWRVDVQQGNGAVHTVPSLSHQPTLNESVYIIDCVWELFVLVGSEARAKRQDIKLALFTAEELSKRSASTKPFTPTVHALILPTRIPTDLRLNFRDLDEAQLNGGNIPDHMNLVPASEAVEHLQKTSWEKGALHDPTMLPLGLDTSLLN